MKCIFCNCTDSRVVDSRPTEDGAIRRRRECERCGRRFTTYEKIETLPLLVIKKDRRREPFDADKIRRGLVKACEKRPVAIADIESLVNEIEMAMLNSMDQEVTTTRIGEMAMDGLRKLDEVSYIRFASVHRQFKDIQTFMRELSQLLAESSSGKEQESKR